ncbi:hypothetical protein ACLB2K_018250 [Fragaria x ananassa]
MQTRLLLSLANLPFSWLGGLKESRVAGASDLYSLVMDITQVPSRHGWFLNLPPNSVANFDQLSEHFLNRFILHASIYHSVDALFHIKQEDGEGLHELLSRWKSATARCHNLESWVAEQAFRQALLLGNFLMEINRNPPASYDALLDLAVWWARANFATFGHSTPATLALPAPPSKQQSQKYEHFDHRQDGSSQDQGCGSDRRQGRQKNRYHPYQSGDQSPPPPGSHNVVLHRHLVTRSTLL